ncbi:hypothetical protein [Actinomadura gamaensis]|uniref:Uncharacterized protein n=1 Tax=Actinomadura gamaensis TaxID=1763541 RepID=A0ABV9TZN7_9ACTN
MKNDQVTQVINALKPTVDELADAAFERRPDPSAIRARAEVSAPSVARTRRPVRKAGFALGAVAALTAAGVAVAVMLPGGDHAPGTTPHTAALDARTVLLASADTAAKQPTTHGTCWYSRTRSFEEYRPLTAAESRAKPDFKPLPYRASVASSSDHWICADPGAKKLRMQSRLPLDIRVTFPSKKDEAAYRKAGSPPLDVNGGTTATKPFTARYGDTSHEVNPLIGSHEIEWRAVPNLPATRQQLDSYLRKLWQQDRRGGAHGYTAPADYCRYVFVTAWDLFMAPTSAGTRSSLYRIMAGCPSIRATGRVTDALGRPGVGLKVGDVRLVVDPATAQLLDFQENASTHTAYEKQGWVDAIGALPAR